MRPHLAAIAAAKLIMSPKSRKNRGGAPTKDTDAGGYTPFDDDATDSFHSHRHQKRAVKSARPSAPSTSRSATSRNGRKRLGGDATSRSEGNNTPSNSNSDEEGSDSEFEESSQDIEVPPLDLEGVRKIERKKTGVVSDSDNDLEESLSDDAEQQKSGGVGMSDREKRARAAIERAKAQLAARKGQQASQQQSSPIQMSPATRKAVSPSLYASHPKLAAAAKAFQSPGPRRRPSGRASSSSKRRVLSGKLSLKKSNGKKRRGTKKKRKSKSKSANLDSLIDDQLQSHKESWREAQNDQLDPGAHKKDRAQRWLQNPTPGGAESVGGGLHSSKAVALFGGSAGAEPELDMFSRMRPRPKLSMRSGGTTKSGAKKQRTKKKKKNLSSEPKAASQAKAVPPKKPAVPRFERPKKKLKAKASSKQDNDDDAAPEEVRCLVVLGARLNVCSLLSPCCEQTRAELKLSPRKVQDNAVVAMMFAGDDDETSSDEESSDEESSDDSVEDDVESGDDEDDNKEDITQEALPVDDQPDKESAASQQPQSATERGNTDGNNDSADDDFDETYGSDFDETYGSDFED